MFKNSQKIRCFLKNQEFFFNFFRKKLKKGSKFSIKLTFFNHNFK